MTDNIRQRINLVEISVVCLEYVNKSIQLKVEGKFSIKIISMLIALNIFMCSKCMKNQYPKTCNFYVHVSTQTVGPSCTPKLRVLFLVPIWIQ